MKKTITITMIVILLLNLIHVSSFAADGDVGIDTSKPVSTEPQEKGNVTLTNDSGKTTLANITGSTYSGGQVAKTLAVVATIPPRAVNACLDLFVEQATDTKGKFTIYNIVLGKYNIFNINFTEQLPKNPNEINTFMEIVKIDVLKFYSFTRNFSIAISLFVLIYMGIRMAISTVASQQAKYKKMLIDWLASIMIVFLMHLIIIVISVVLQYGLSVVENIAQAWNLQSFEETVYSNAVTNLSAHGFNAFTSVVIIWVLTWYQVKFFLYYLHRTLEVHFLVIIAPLVTITYPIDKAGDNKAQAFGNLIKELIIKCSMQLIHSIVYIVFIGTAGVIAVSQPLIAIVFFMALSRAEKITRNIIGVKDEGFQKTQVLEKIPFID